MTRGALTGMGASMTSARGPSAFNSSSVRAVNRNRSRPSGHCAHRSNFAARMERDVLLLGKRKPFLNSVIDAPRIKKHVD